MRTLQLDRDRAEASVVGLVLRRVRERVVGAQLLVHLGQSGRQVVAVLEQEAARLIGQPAEAAAGGEAQGVLVALEQGQAAHRLQGGDGAAGERVAVLGLQPALKRIDRPPGLVGGAGGAEAPRVHRVDAHVRAVRGRHHGAEGGLDARRDREALGEEHDRLPSGNRLQAAHEGEQGVQDGEALLVALQGFERFEEAAVEDLEVPDQLVFGVPALGHPGQLGRGHVGLADPRREAGIGVADGIPLARARDRGRGQGE